MRRGELKTKQPLKATKSLRDSYREKLESGEKEKYVPKRKPQTPKNKQWSIFTSDLNTCHITGSTDRIHVHHIFGAANKSNSEKYGFLVPLRKDWHNMADYGIHFNKELNYKYKRACQEYWLAHYGTKEEFIEVFGKWW